MFDSRSRYYSLPTSSLRLADGTELRYVARRFLPQGENMPIIGEVRTVQGDRLDQITYRTLGDPLIFWRIADANNAMDPFDLVDGPDLPIRIPNPS